jgi:pyruvate/oxaloacetate carboxyltransferase
MYAETPLRKPTFDVKKAIKPIGAFFVRIFDAFVEARRLQAAMETAQHLKAHNKDFRHMSLGDIVNQIMEDTK